MWVDFEVQRGLLDLQMGTMQLDSEGLWIDPGPIGLEFGYPTIDVGLCPTTECVPAYARPSYGRVDGVPTYSDFLNSAEGTFADPRLEPIDYGPGSIPDDRELRGLVPDSAAPDLPPPGPPEPIQIQPVPTTGPEKDVPQTPRRGSAARLRHRR